MKFIEFKNSTDYLEYLQIFTFKKIILENNTNFSIEEYHDFELTDNLIKEYNNWIIEKNSETVIIINWFSKNEQIVEHFKLHFNSIYKPKVCLWSDRSKTNYYKEKLQDSFLFENHIAELLKNQFGLEIGAYLTSEGQYELGENALGIEIKNDTLIEKYGNVYIEYQEKSNANNYNFVDSGILKKDNCKYFLIGTKDNFYIFKKTRLIEIFNEEYEIFKNNNKSNREILFKQIATSKGFAYPVRKAKEDMISIEEMVEEIKKQINK